MYAMGLKNKFYIAFDSFYMPLNEYIIYIGVPIRPT